MKKIKTLLLLIPILFLSYSCNEPKYPMKIGDNYFFGYWKYGIVYYNNIHIVEEAVVAWNYDSTFIIAKQKPYDEICDSLMFKYNRLPDREKIYHKTEKYYYWIIDKRVEVYYIPYTEGRYKGGFNRIMEGLNGPLSYAEYWAKRKELGVPDSLKLLETEKMVFDSPFHAWYYKWTYKPPARERVVE